MSAEHWRNIANRGDQVFGEKPLPLPLLQPQIPMDWPEIEAGYTSLMTKDRVVRRVMGHGLTYIL
jgi:hypothetical protein